MEIIISFVIGFCTIWFLGKEGIKFEQTKCPLKDSVLEIVKNYPKSEKLTKEIKLYSMDKVKKGNIEYIEVIETINRNKNDKT